MGLGARFMIRISTIFIAICMVLVAASLGLTLYSLAGVSAGISGVVALAALTFMILHHAVSMQMRGGTNASTQIADLSRGTADLARQVMEFGRRIVALEGRLAAMNDTEQDSTPQPREHFHSVTGEITELGTLVRQLADSVAAHDEILANHHDMLTSEAGAIFSHAAPEIAPGTPHAPAPPAPANVNNAHVLSAVKNAIEASRIDLYLQPMVTLPQRKVRFYEAVSRLRDNQDNVLTAGDFITTAESAGLMGQIDLMVMFRCVQVLRRLQGRSKDIGMFCNIASATLGHPASFAQCLDFLETNRALAPFLVLEFKQSTFRNFGPMEREHLTSLQHLGYRFSIDNVTDLRIDPRELADRGVRFIKVPASLLLDQRQSSSTDIHAADLSNLLGRFGIDLIAEKIEGERSVVDLLDYDVRFGQGFLFAPPRPLRAEAAAIPTTSASTPVANGLSGSPARVRAASADVPRTGNAALVRRASAKN